MHDTFVANFTNDIRLKFRTLQSQYLEICSQYKSRVGGSSGYERKLMI